VVTLNSELESNPEVINSDPYGRGWIVEIETIDQKQFQTLLSPQDYQKLTA
jgi:glycine cleavage system H protein